MNMERPCSPSATMVAPTSKRRSTSIETRRSRPASERPPKKGVASKNAFRSGELTAIGVIYSRSRRRQAGQTRGGSWFARPVLDDLDDARQIVLCAALKDAVLEDVPHRLANPHRHAEFFALRDCEVDVLHEYLDGGTKVETACQHRLGKNVHRCEIAAGSIVEDVQHGVGRNAGLARHRHCLRRGDQS